MPATSGRPRLVSSAPVLLLVASLALVAVLGWQAIAAAADHRALVSRVLRDYADLATIEVVRRGSTFLFTYGFDVAAQALTNAQATAPGTLPSRDAIAAALPRQSRRAIELVGDVLRVDTARRGVESSGAALPATVRGDLLTVLQAPPLSSAPARVLVLTTDQQTRIFAFANGGLRTESDTDHLGFEVRLDAVAVWLHELVLGQPLLPASLASKEVAESSLSMDVRLPDGRSLLQPSVPQIRADLTVARPWSDEASRRVLPGVTVVSAIDSSAASSLIIGDLAESRLGLLLVLFVVASALSAAAVFQLRRERALATLRQDFVTRTSHELRTPVARIRIFTDTLLLDRVRTEEERREAVRAIDRAARRLSILVENVLQFSRMESRDVGYHLESTDVVALVRDVVQEFETTMSGAHVTVSGASAVAGNAKADEAYALIDREAVRQALLNLLDNAWKYGGAERPIRVAVAPTEGEIRIRVSDSGPGVPEQDRTRIWEPYVRLDRDRRSSVAGTGIGLSVVRDVVRRHRGTAWVETAESGGAAFVLALPAAHPASEPSRSLA